MPLYVSRDRNKRRHIFSGQNEAEDLLRFLNRPLNDPNWSDLPELTSPRNRVLNLIRKIQTTFDEIDSDPNLLGAPTPDPARKNLRYGYPDEDVESGEWGEPFGDLNDELLLYTTVRFFVPDRSSPRRWTIASGCFTDSHFTEAEIVLSLIELVKSGVFEKLKECQCGEWFLAKFAHQRFHSEPCRLRFWEQSDERKERKRERARKNYLYKKAFRRKP